MELKATVYRKHVAADDVTTAYVLVKVSTGLPPAVITRSLENMFSDVDRHAAKQVNGRFTVVLRAPFTGESKEQEQERSSLQSR